MYYWLVAGLLMVFLELVTPGFYFLWIGISAVITGGINYIFPELDFIYLGTMFAVISVVLCYFGKVSLYKKVSNTSDSTLNRRGAQYIGTTVIVVDDIINGTGKIKVGDTVWGAKSDKDISSGTNVKIVNLDGIAFIVE